MTETAHRLEQRRVESGETLESMGFSPDDVFFKESHEDRRTMTVWFLTEVEVDD